MKNRVGTSARSGRIRSSRSSTTRSSTVTARWMPRIGSFSAVTEGPKR